MTARCPHEKSPYEKIILTTLLAAVKQQCRDTTFVNQTTTFNFSMKSQAL